MEQIAEYPLEYNLEQIRKIKRKISAQKFL